MNNARRLRPRALLRTLLVALTAVLVVATVGIYVGTRWPQRLPKYTSQYDAQLSFDQVAEPGFDESGRERLADSAWSMRYFQADGATTGYLYAGTDNNIIGLTLAALQRRRSERRSARDPEYPGPADPPVRPPQIRRYRPDLGPTEWEVVMDYANYEQPPYLNEGFRSMAVYKAMADGRTYLYAGTMAAHNPTVWRTATGDPGGWEKVFTFPDDPRSQIGSVRGMVAHDDGLLYVSTTRSGDILPGGIGEIWATDGLDFTPVITDGFGNPDNTGVSALASFDGCLYAGTYNANTGYEVWKLRCTSDPGAPPQQVISEGAGQHYNEAAMNMQAFKGQLYIGTGIPLGFNPLTRHGPRGCSVVRVGPDDRWDMVVGPRRERPLSSYQGGFGWYLNAYCWYMEEYHGELYLGTWDLSRTIAFLGQDAENVAPAFKPLLKELVARPEDWGSPMGGDLYRTADGIHWEPVFLDGLGDPDNHGIRTLESTPLGLFVGTENPFSRLQIWLLPN